MVAEEEIRARVNDLVLRNNLDKAASPLMSSHAKDREDEVVNFDLTGSNLATQRDEHLKLSVYLRKESTGFIASQLLERLLVHRHL